MITSLRIGYIVPGFPADDKDWFTPAVAETIQKVSETQRVRVFSLYYPAETQPYRWNGIPVTPAGGYRLFSRQRLLRRIFSAHRNELFDVLHAFWVTGAGVTGALAAERTRIPLVVTCAGGELVDLNDIGYGDWRTGRGHRSVSVAMRQASVILAGSEYQKTLIGKRDKTWEQKSMLLPLGVDTHRFSPPAHREERPYTTLLSVAGLVPVKNHRLLLSALSRLKDKAWRLNVVGDGPLRSELEDFAAQAGLSDRIVWTGWIHHRDIIPYYHDADVFVMTSDHEAQNVAMLEAMGCGLPVVATAVGLAPEIMARHGNGVCVPVRDAEKLADALAEFMDDPTRRRDAGMSSRQAIEACDHERLVPALIEVYRRLGSAN